MENDRIKTIEHELDTIKQRNKRVETDKAWEISGYRIGTICVITYLTAAVVLYVSGAQNFYLGAIVPAVGFFLSAQSLPVIKKWWMTKILK